MNPILVILKLFLITLFIAFLSREILSKIQHKYFRMLFILLAIVVGFSSIRIFMAGDSLTLDYVLKYPSTELKIEFTKPLSSSEAYSNVHQIMEFLSVKRKIYSYRTGKDGYEEYHTTYLPHYWKQEGKNLYIYFSTTPPEYNLKRFKANFRKRFLKQKNIRVNQRKLLLHIDYLFSLSHTKEAKEKQAIVAELLKHRLNENRRYFNKYSGSNDLENFITQKTFLLNFKGKAKSISVSKKLYSPLYSLGENEL